MAEIPKFTTEQEEAEFWATHDATEFLDETEAADVIFVDARSGSRQAWLQRLYTMFAPVRTQAKAIDEAEIDASIDEAVDEVQSEQSL
jgi:hypothetical protein